MLTTQNYVGREGETPEVQEVELAFANHTNGQTWDEPEPAFLNIVTRCYKRSAKLEVNQRSIQNQSDGDWRQILLHDNVGIGLRKANGLFAKYKHLVKGEYVLLLDDDDKIIDDDFIKKLKERDEDIVWFKMQYTSCGKDRWNYLGENEGIQPSYGKIGGSCLVVKNDVYQKHIHHFEKDSGGDYFFMQEIWKPEHGYTKHHMGDTPVTAVQSVGGGKPDDAS